MTKAFFTAIGFMIGFTLGVVLAERVPEMVEKKRNIHCSYYASEWDDIPFECEGYKVWLKSYDYSR